LPDSSQDSTAFARVVRALHPYLDELVFVGGWAHRLLALHELAGALDFQPLMTSDADIATPSRSRVQGSSMRDLLRQNGFTEELSGDERPPVTGYRLGEEEGALYVEFLAPQAGGPTRRDGSSDATIEVAGITAHDRLRNAERIARESGRASPPTADQIRLVCQQGLEHIFGSKTDDR